MKKHLIRIFFVLLGMLIYYYLVLGYDSIIRMTSTFSGLAIFVLVNVVGSALIYWLARSFVLMIAQDKILRKQQALVAFPTRIMTVHSLDGEPLLRFQCNDNGCDGYLAIPEDKADGKEVFCLKCGRKLDKEQVHNIVGDVGTSVAFM